MKEKKIRWYACRKDALLVAALVCGSFWLNPITQFYAWFRWKDDLGVGGMLSVLAVMLVVGTLLCKRHFWSWSFISVLGIYATREMAVYMYQPTEYYTVNNYINEAVINGAIFFALMLPALACLQWIKKKSCTEQ